ncbi:DUF4307 domain-containing protein [Nocardioides alkalitolerans]|uniref:DUF4307 domain-containing protein n=1 Tax=Nocardioides alkalitolerans TaxID=281714 RepID=UPI0003FB2158|nr:DUF4307 domain-containing protein [Nocardioides alkalitolerans]
MSPTSSALRLDERYGRRQRPGRRRVIIAASAALGVVAGGWLLWTAWFHGSPEVSSQLQSWEVLDDQQVRVKFDVALSGDEVATCRVRALSVDHTAVGDLAVQIPGDAGTASGGVVEFTFRTLREATSVELMGCTTPSQNRPR